MSEPQQEKKETERGLGPAAAPSAGDRRGLGIRTLLVLLVLAPVTLLIAGMSAVVWRLADVERDTQRVALSYTARTAAAAVDREIGRYLALGQHLSRSPRLLDKDISAFEAEARLAFEPGEDVWILVSEPDGRQILNLAAPPGTPLPRRSPVALACINQAFETRKPVVSEMFKGAVLHKWIANIELPVFKDGQPFRVLTITMDMQGFQRLLNAQNMPRNWLAGVVDQNGRLVARVPFGDRYLGEPAAHNWRDIKSREGVFDAASLEGDSIVVANARTAYGWTVAVAIKTSELQAAAWEAARTAAMLGGALIAFSILLAVLIGRRITRPIAELRDNAAALVEGAPVSFAPRLPEVEDVWRSLHRAWMERTRSEEALRESEERLRLFVDRAPAAIAMFDSEMRYLAASQRYVLDYRLPYASGAELVGRSHYDVFPQLSQRWRDVDRRVLAGERLSTEEQKILRPDGRVDWVRWEMSPWRRADNSVGGALLFSEIITDRRLAAEALRESEERLRFALAAAEASTWEVVPSAGEFRTINRAAALQGPAVGMPTSVEKVLATIHPDDRSRLSEAIAQTMKTGARFIVETRVIRADGSIRWFESRAELRRDLTPPKLVGLSLDITERKLASEQVQLLLREVNHRSKNLLTLVLGIARRTFARHPEDFLSTFSARVGALAANQDVLVQHEWKDVEIGALVRSQLDPFKDAIAARVTTHGPLIYVTAAAAQTIGMAVHELATNALKYGSLMSPDGQVEIEWIIERGDVFRMDWRESGGPPVRAPAKTGFGTTVIRDATRSSLGAQIEIDYAPAGFRWRMECPLSRIAGSETSAAPAPQETPPASAKAARGARVLIVEDEPLVALEIREVLEEAGFSTVGPSARAAHALRLLAEAGCDAAVLDINLGVETSESVAEELKRRRIPFVTLSGYARQQRPAAFAGAPALGKPVATSTLVETLARVIDESTRSNAPRQGETSAAKLIDANAAS